MSHKLIAITALLAVAPLTALADIEIMDPYARAASPAAKAGGAYMILHNTGNEDDRLIAASTEASEVTQLHTHIEDADVVMRMTHIEEGLVIKAGEKLLLERGGNHVMMMGLTRSLDQGDAVDVTLTFEKAGDKVVKIPVDLKRQPASHSH